MDELRATMERQWTANGGWSLLADKEFADAFVPVLRGWKETLLSIRQQRRKLHGEIRDAEIRLRNAFTELDLLADSQFVEHTVDALESPHAAETANNHPVAEDDKLEEEQEQERVRAEYVEAWRLSKDAWQRLCPKQPEPFVDADPMLVESGDAECSLDLQAKERFAHRPLPHLIGSEAFLEDDYVGLFIETPMRVLEERSLGRLLDDYDIQLPAVDEQLFQTETPPMLAEPPSSSQELSPDSDSSFENLVAEIKRKTTTASSSASEPPSQWSSTAQQEDGFGSRRGTGKSSLSRKKPIGGVPIFAENQEQLEEQFRVRTVSMRSQKSATQTRTTTPGEFSSSANVDDTWESSSKPQSHSPMKVPETVGGTSILVEREKENPPPVAPEPTAVARKKISLFGSDDDDDDFGIFKKSTAVRPAKSLTFSPSILESSSTNSSKEAAAILGVNATTGSINHKKIGSLFEDDEDAEDDPVSKQLFGSQQSKYLNDLFKSKKPLITVPAATLHNDKPASSPPPQPTPSQTPQVLSSLTRNRPRPRKSIPSTTARPAATRPSETPVMLRTPASSTEELLLPSGGVGSSGDHALFDV